MKFNSEKDHFSEKTFSNIKNCHLLLYVSYYRYNRWQQSINWGSIEIVIKINLEKSWLKIKFSGHFLLEKAREFHGLHDDVKFIWKR